MYNPSTKGTKAMLLASFLASSIGVAPAQSNQAQDKPGRTSSASKVASTAALSASWHARYSTYFKRNWGVSVFGVRAVSSGSMLEFRYRVLDAQKAKALNDKRAMPVLIDEKTGISLSVPAMENIGSLRQTSASVDGKVYWMVFANPGNLVQRGSLVDVVIGNFRVEGLVVE